MPHLAKRHVSQYVRRTCKRRLRFDLYSGSLEEELLVGPGGEAIPNPPPERETVRRGLPLLAEAGRVLEREHYEELETIFPGRPRGPRRATRAPW